MSVEKLGIEIEALVKDLSSLRELVQDLRNIQSQAAGTSEAMARFQRQTEQLRSLKETFSTLESAGLKMMAFSGGILFGAKKMAQGFIQSAAEMEKYELTLETLFKSKELAKAELEWAKRFEDLTPYALKDIIKSTVIFRSFGLDAKKYLGLAGDMAAAFGGDSATLQSAVMGLAKALASGAGAMDILRESFGITGDQLKKFGWKGKEDLIGFRKALESLLKERFAGSMEKLSKTFPAYLEGFKSYGEKFQAAIGKPLLEKITPDIAQLYAGLQKLWDTGQLQKWAAVFADIFKGIYSTIKDTIKIIAAFVKPILELLSRHPELAKFAGKILFIGSALTFSAGAALMLLGHISGLIISVLQLTRAIGGLKVLLPILRSISSGLIQIGLLGAAAFVGWKIGELLNQLKIGDKTLGEWVQKLYEITIFKKELETGRQIETGQIWDIEIAQLKKYREEIIKNHGLTLKQHEELKRLARIDYRSMTKEQALSAIERAIALREKIKLRPGSINNLMKLPRPEIPELPEITPPSVPSPAYEITAPTTPEISNYYYTIHFERDSVQINTLDLTPEKFQKALFEFFKRHALAPQTP